MNETSDFVLSILCLLRDKIPCSENFYRMKYQHQIMLGYNLQEDETKLFAACKLDFV